MSGRSRCRLATCLLVGAWLAFLGWQAMVLIRTDPGMARAHGSKDVWAAFIYLTVGLLAGGVYVGGEGAGRPGPLVPGYTKVLRIASVLSLLAALVVHVRLWFLDARDPGSLMTVAGHGFAGNVLVCFGLVLLAVVRARVAGLPLAPPLSAAAGVVLLLAFPLGTPVGVWWWWKIRPRESVADTPAVPAAA